MFEGGDSDNEVPGAFGSSTGRKGSTKLWPRIGNLGSDEQSNAPSLSLENGGGMNTSTMGHGRLPWGNGRSPPLNNTQSGGNALNSKVKSRASTSSTKRTSLWGLSSVGFFHTSLVLLFVVCVHKATELVLCSVISRNLLSLTFGEHLIEAVGSD